MRPGDPAFSHAFLQALVKRVIRLPLTFLPVRWNTQGQSTSSAFNRSCSVRVPEILTQGFPEILAHRVPGILAGWS